MDLLDRKATNAILVEERNIKEMEAVEVLDLAPVVAETPLGSLLSPAT